MKGAVLVAIAASIGNFLQGWDNATIAGSILYIKKDLALQTTMEGLVVAMSLIGATVITTCSGPISDWLGRRPMMIISSVLYFLGSLVMLWSPNVYVLCLARLLDGFGIGLAVTLVPVYISETAPSDIRGSLNTLPQFSGSGGMFLSYCMVFVMSLSPSPSWRIMLGVLSIPSLFYFLLTVFFLPESPRWLVSKGKMLEAKKVLQRLRGQDDVSGEMALLVEGLGIGGDASIEEYIIGPADEVGDGHEQTTDKDKIRLYGSQAGLSWLAKPVTGQSSLGLVSRHGSLVMDPLVTLFGSIHEKLPETGSMRSALFPNFGSMFSTAEPHIKTEHWDEESLQREGEDYVSDGAAGDSDDDLHSPLISRQTTSLEKDLPPPPSHGSLLNSMRRHSSLMQESGEPVGSTGIGGGWQLAWKWSGKGDDGKKLIMATHISQCILFSYITFLHLIFITLAHYDNYIIHMNLSAMPKAFSTHHTWYLSTLSSALENPQLTTTNNLNSPISSKLIYTYTHVINGFSANLSPKEHESLKNAPGYISSIRDLHMKLDTTHSPQFLGLNPNIGAWHDSKFGKDVIVGVIDTGVWPESESFKDDGMTKIPSKWKGQCENSIHFNSSLCNKKLIGAKFFNKGLLAKYPNITLGLNSTRDTEGHGTHTSTTAAGSRVDHASFFGYAAGTASGIASKSRVAMYKAIWQGPLVTSDVIAAIDAAISDGVDVISLSFGINDVPLYEDAVAIATFAAMEKGVFVSTSAGNNGPALKTLHNGTPWVITVAAGTMDRDFQGTLTLGNGNKIIGLSLYVGTFSTQHVPIVFMDLCDNFNELKKVKSKIIVCEDKNGTGLFDQINNLNAAKAFGAVLISNVSDIFYSQNSFATIIVNPINGEIVKAYIKSSNSTSIASMSFMKTVFGTKPAPSVDSYSSRGPSYSCPFVLKPDITAPGTSILAAWPTNVPVLEFESQKHFSEFNVISGTSMACPHVAGVAALLKGVHSDWSPAAIRSAIMTTSDIFDNAKEHIKDIGTDKAATPFALGAGHVNPNRALDPGLVYDVGVQDYVNLLCALKYSQKNITTITRSSSNDCSKPSLDLNYPSFIAFVNDGNSSSRPIQEFHRTVTNVGDGQAIYVASIAPIKGFRVTVIPNKLVFNEKNEKLSYKLRIEVASMTKLKKVAFGYLTWMDVKHVVRSPIVVTSLKLKF